MKPLAVAPCDRLAPSFYLAQDGHEDPENEALVDSTRNIGGGERTHLVRVRRPEQTSHLTFGRAALERRGHGDDERIPCRRHRWNHRVRSAGLTLGLR